MNDDEGCNCQAGRNEKAGASLGGSELKYTNTVKKQILMIYILSVITGIIVGIVVCGFVRANFEPCKWQ